MGWLLAGKTRGPYGGLWGTVWHQRVSEVSSPWWSNLLAGTIRGTKTSLISCVLESGYVPRCRGVNTGRGEKKKKKGRGGGSHTGRRRWYYRILIFLPISPLRSSNWIHGYDVDTWRFIIGGASDAQRLVLQAVTLWTLAGLKVADTHIYCARPLAMCETSASFVLIKAVWLGLCFSQQASWRHLELEFFQTKLDIFFFNFFLLSVWKDKRHKLPRKNSETTYIYSYQQQHQVGDWVNSNLHQRFLKICFALISNWSHAMEEKLLNDPSTKRSIY